MNRLPVLEIGAGAHRDPDVDAYNDIQPFEGLHYHCDARALPCAEASFSIITANQMIEHLDEQGQKELLAECWRLLAQEGLLLLWTPDLDWMDAALAAGSITPQWYDTLHQGRGDGPYDGHRLMHTRQSLEALLIAAGFRVLSIREVGGSIEAVAFKET